MTERIHTSALPGVVDLVSLQEADPERFPFLLESVIHGSASARYSILMAAGDERLDLRQGVTTSNGREVSGAFLDQLDRWFLSELHQERSALPFVGGWFLYLGYELAGEVEPVSYTHLTLPTILRV